MLLYKKLLLMTFGTALVIPIHGTEGSIRHRICPQLVSFPVHKHILQFINRTCQTVVLAFPPVVLLQLANKD